MAIPVMALALLRLRHRDGAMGRPDMGVPPDLMAVPELRAVGAAVAGGHGAI